MKDTQDWLAGKGKESILAKMKEYNSFPDYEQDALYHGTSELIKGRLTVGAYDGILWTGKTPDIAQNYIPECGLSAMHFKPGRWEMDNPVRLLRRGDMIFGLLKQMGYDISAEFDDMDNVLRYSIKKEGVSVATPTNSDAYGFLTDRLGYDKDVDAITVKMAFVDKTLTPLPKDYKRKGELYILSGASKLNLYDMAVGESDLGDRQYHRCDLFRKLEEKGYDGVVINDFAQSKIQGNFGHKSTGLFKSALEKMDFFKIDAVNHDWVDYDDFRSKSTAEIQPKAWFELSRKPLAQAISLTVLDENQLEPEDFESSGANIKFSRRTVVDVVKHSAEDVEQATEYEL